MEYLVKQHIEIQQLMDDTLLDIALNFSEYQTTQDQKLVKPINDNVEFFQKNELKLQKINFLKTQL